MRPPVEVKRGGKTALVSAGVCGIGLTVVALLIYREVNLSAKQIRPLPLGHKLRRE